MQFKITPLALQTFQALAWSYCASHILGWIRSWLQKRLKNCLKHAADHCPSWSSCDQGKLFSSDLCCAISLWDRLLSSTLLSSHRTSKYADDDMLGIQKPLSWRRPMIGAGWSNFSWEGILFTAILKTAVWTLFRFSLFFLLNPLFFLKSCSSLDHQVINRQVMPVLFPWLLPPTALCFHNSAVLTTKILSQVS